LIVAATTTMISIQEVIATRNNCPKIDLEAHAKDIESSEKREYRNITMLEFRNKQDSLEQSSTFLSVIYVIVLRTRLIKIG
jgi:hypothetical protein